MTKASTKKKSRAKPTAKAKAKPNAKAKAKTSKKKKSKKVTSDYPKPNGPRYKLSGEAAPMTGKTPKKYLHSVYKEEYCELVVEMMSEGKSFAAFLSTIGVLPETAHYWYKNYAEFREAKDRAILKGLQYWEEIGERATRGELPGHSAQLYKFLIKNRYPQVYRDVQEIKKEVSVKFETSVNEQGQIEQSRTIEESRGIIDISDNEITKELGGNDD